MSIFNLKNRLEKANTKEDIKGKKTKIVSKGVMSKVKDNRKSKSVTVTQKQKNRVLRKSLAKKGFTNIKIRNGSMVSSIDRNGKEIKFDDR